MFRVRRVRGFAVGAFLLFATSGVAAPFTSQGSGNWNSPATWGGTVPGTGDDVTITSNHIVTVTDARVVQSVTFDSVTGNKMLVIDPGGSLLVESPALAVAIGAPSPGSTSIVRMNGGQLNTSGIGTGISIAGGVSSAAKLEFTSLGGTATIEGNIVFSGTAANAVIDFDSNAGTLELGGDLGSGGTILNVADSTVDLIGSGPQTINGYTFHDFVVSKTGGTATLNSAITVLGDLTVSTGVLDDGGYQILLNGGSTSSVNLGSTGVLKLGSAGTATNFPSPIGSTSFNPGSTVVYQSGATQTIETSIPYENLWLSTMGGAVNKSLSGALLDVDGNLDIWDNGANTVTLSIAGAALDLGGNLAGDGTVSLTTGTMNIGGSFSSSASLNAGTSTITYDGTGPQNALGAVYHNLTINKIASIATVTGSLSAANVMLTSGTFDLGAQTLTLNGDMSVFGGAAFNSSMATLVLNGSTLQTLSTTASFALSTLTVNNPAGASFGLSTTNVSAALNLNGGTISGYFFVDVLAAVNRTSGWIIGELGMGMNPSPARRFHVGTATSYIPVDVDAGSAGTLTVRANDGKSPDRTADNVLNRYWTLTAGTVVPIDTITFNYNQSDFVDGDETKYILASYDSGSFLFSHYGDVDDVNNNVSATNVSDYQQDWMIGQPGSLAAASKLEIITINGGTDPSESTPFDVVVQSTDDGGAPTPVFDPTDVTLSVAIGSGSLGGTITGQIPAGDDNVTITGVTYAPAETNVALGVARTTGDVLDPGMSSTFDVLGAPSTLTVSNLNDSGTDSLRDAINTANAGSCTAPCVIEFSIAGEINFLSSLPPIIAPDLTINGFSAPGAMPNTNAFGLPSNATLTVALDGGGMFSGLDVQSTNVKIAGLAIKNFTPAGVNFTGTNTGSSVVGCYIGTDIGGSTAAANPAGVQVTGSTGATIGGALPADRNLISGNTSWGIFTFDNSTVTILGNYAGTNASLTGSIPNHTGIKACDDCTVTIGTAGIGNIASGNSNTGISVSSDNATVRSNYVGTAGSGTTAIPNVTGISIEGTATFNTIGGPSPSDVNIISGNSGNGILVRGNDNTIDNNWIGVAQDGTTPLGNGASGIRVDTAAARTIIGTTFGNKLVFNTNDGATVADFALGTVIRRGKIAGNVNRGIDLNDDGTTANDITDTDIGSNNLQNFPVINEAKTNAGNVDVKVSLDSSGGVNTNFFIFDVYKADASSPAQAIEYLGNSGCVTGNVFINHAFSVPAGTAVTGSHVVATATAYSNAGCTTPSEGTSELSPSVRIGGAIHWISGNGNWETAANWNPAIVPTTSDAAYIDNPGTYTVTINSVANVGAVHVGAVSGAQNLTISLANSLNLNSGNSTVTTNGTLTMNGTGIGVGGGALNVSGTFNWNIGAVTGAGGVTMASGSTLNLDTVSAKSVNAGSLTIGGGATANWLNGAMQMANGGYIDNAGLFDIKTDNTISDTGSAGTFDNTGTLRKSATAGVTQFTGITLNHDAGTIDIQTGTLNVAGGTAIAPITISSGATMLIDDNTYVFANGAGVTGAGKVYISGGTLNVTGPSVGISHLRLDSGNLGGSGSALSGTNGWEWNGGTMNGGGSTVIESGGSLVIGTLGTKNLDNRTLTLQSSSTTTVTGSGSINLLNGGNISNAGLFNTATDVILADTGSDGGFTNTATGTFRKSAGGLATVITNIDFANNGTIDIQTGSFNPGNINNHGPIQLTGGMTVDNGVVQLNTASNVSGTGLLRIDGGTLTHNESPDTLPNVQLDSGTLNGSATFNVTTLVWNGGTMSGTGTTTIPNSGTATIATATAKSLQRAFSAVSGSIVNVTGTGAINMSTGGSITNDGTFDITAAVTFNDSGTAGDINSTRTFRTNHAGTTTLTGITFNSSTPAGLIDIQNGSLDLADGTNSGVITIGSGAGFLVNSDTYTLASGTTVTGAGTINLSGGTLNVTGNVSAPNFAQTNGTLDGAGTFTITGIGNWTTGTMQGGGTTEVAASGALNLITPSTKTLNNRTLSSVALGTINLTGNGPVNMSNGANITNAGLLLITANNTFSDAGTSGNIVNTGTIRKQTATGPTTLSNLSLTNTGGLIDIQSGTIDVTGDTFSQSAAGTLKVWLNGTTPGTGFGQLTSTNNVNAAGTLEIALVGPYQPVGGNTFRVVSAPGHVGDFTQPYTYPALASGRSFGDAWDGSGLLLTVNGTGDLAIAKGAPSNVFTGDPIAYTLSVSNAGPDIANSLSVTDTLAAGHTGISANGTGWSCNVVSLTVTCTRATLGTGAAPPITINATAPASPTSFTNVANVASSNDPNGGDNSGSAFVTIDALQTDLEVSSLSPIAPVAPLTPFTFTFVIENNGPQDASNVALTAPIPTTLTYNSAVPDTGTCNFSSNTVVCHFGGLLNGATVEVDINLTTTTTAGTHVVTGVVSANEPDTNPGNNSIATPVEVTGGTITVTNTNDAGMGSLREALDDAENGTCTLPCLIDFNIPGPGPHVIQPATVLPAMDDQTTVDATTQSGYTNVPLIQLDGQSTLATGLEMSGDDSAVRGFSITGFTKGMDINGDDNTLEASYIGLDLLGAAAANSVGIRLSGHTNTIGGTSAAQRNIISGNTSAGVLVEGDALDNVISGNYIGTDPAGTSAVPNATGVSITDDADATTVGGPTAAHRNVIAGNTAYGVYIEGFGGSSTVADGSSALRAGGVPATNGPVPDDGVLDDNVIQNNWIGPDASGTATLGATTGIELNANVKYASISDNVISGNQNGIAFSASTVSLTSITNNLIGVAPDGTTPMGNSQAGILVVDGFDNLVESNQIAHNGTIGVKLLGGQATNIHQNSIHDNVNLGIDINADGVTPNDSTDPDVGPNGIQNFPTLTSVALTGGGDASISSNIDSSGSPTIIGSIRIDYFEADASGEGQTYIGFACIDGNSFGLTTSANWPSLAPGDPVVATATSYNTIGCNGVADGTSELSNVVLAVNCTPPPVTITGPTTSCPGGPGVTLDAGPGFDEYLWSTGATTQTITVSPSSATTYTVTVKDGIGCPNSDSHTVNVTTPPSVTITGPTQMCAGAPAVTLDAGAGFTGYLWSNGATTQTISVSPSSTTTYSVTVTDGSSCQGTDSHSVAVDPLPVVNISGPSSICAGGTVTLDAGAGFASYLWSNGAMSQTITVPVASTQTFSVTVSDGTCSATDSHTVTTSPNPTVPITAPPAVCENSTGNSASVAVQPGATYNWTIGNGTITGGIGTHAITFTAGPSGNVTLGITVTLGTCVSMGSTNVPVATPPVVNITGPTTACASTNVTLDAGAGFGSYLWSTGATTQTITVAVAVTQNYSVTVSNVPGCSTTDTHTVTVTSAPTAVIDAPSPVNPNQANLVASVPVQPGATYAWSITNGSITSGNGTHSIVFTAGASGITHVSVTVTLGGCSTSFTQAVFIEGSTQPTTADLSVTKSAPTTVQAGAALTYTIGARNLGPGAANNTVLTDTLPAGTTFVALNAGAWNCTRNGQLLTCTRFAPAGMNSTILVTVNAPQAAGTITNTVQITSTTTDPNGGNNAASASTSVTSQTTECSFTPPSLLQPADNASLTSPVAFSWSAVTGASEYELWIGNALAAVTPSTGATLPLSSGTSQWFVIARFPNGCAPLTSAQRTVTVQQTGNCTTATAPQITVPQAGTVSAQTTFMWTPVAQAIGYRLWIEANGTGAQDAGSTNGATSLSVDLPSGSIVAYVEALFSGCPTARSAVVQLQVPRPDPCVSRTTAQPLSPANGAVITSSSIDFAWSDATGADGYRVWYSLDAAPFAVLGSTTSDTTLKATIGRGSVVWYVETLHDGCASTKSQNRQFAIPPRSECTQARPENQSPANNATVTGATVQFVWSAVQGTVAYEVWAAVDNGTPVLLGTTNTTSLTRVVPAGKIDWFVRAIVDRCGPRDSQKTRFTLALPDACRENDRPLPVSPLSGATISTPVRFDWSNVNASQYELFLIRGDAPPQLVATTSATEVSGVDVAPGKVRWFVRAHFGNGCPPRDSGERRLEVVSQPNPCSDLTAPVVTAPGQITTGVPLLLQWTPVNGATAYQVLIADNASFTGAAISTVTVPELPYEGANATANPLLRYIRVRAIDTRCQPASISPYGPAHVLFILPKGGNVGAALFGTDSLSLELELGPQYAGQSFSAAPKQPWITVTPASGVVPAGGIKLSVTADTSDLPIGTSIGSISVTFGNSGAGISTNDGPIGFPLGISLVTPVTPNPTNTPPPDALIIPAIAHADGINSHFQSDVRVSNTSAQLVTYQLTFTPSGDTGITQGQQTTFSVEPGRTIALDDILKSWFATGTGSAMGSLEIRPLTQLSTSTPGIPFSGLANLASFASSRTFNVTANGTFGQYIPAIPFANFIGSQRILSLQQIAQSPRYRTNLGIVEGSGDPASLIVRMFGTGGSQLGSFPVNLNGGQHVQLNAFLRDHGVDNLTDGRVEIEVVSGAGKVTAYASVLDNQTSDPLLVTPVEISGAGATRWVVPGVADLASGFANWQTDMRVFNAGTTDAGANITFYSQNGGTPRTVTAVIPAGQVLQYDRALQSLFGVSNDGGAVHIETLEPARLIATARTYNQTTGGTYGQFISAVTPNEAAGAGDRPLQLLQVEESDRYRSNVGIVEVTGNPVQLEITAVPPDAKFTAVTELFLGGNEFRQLGSLLRGMGLADTHNARVTVRVLNGTGRITAYASVIDMLTNDPTYVPAQ